MVSALKQGGRGELRRQSMIAVRQYVEISAEAFYLQPNHSPSTALLSLGLRLGSPGCESPSLTMETITALFLPGWLQGPMSCHDNTWHSAWHMFDTQCIQTSVMLMLIFSRPDGTV